MSDLEPTPPSPSEPISEAGVEPTAAQPVVDTGADGEAPAADPAADRAAEPAATVTAEPADPSGADAGQPATPPPFVEPVAAATGSGGSTGRRNQMIGLAAAAGVGVVVGLAVGAAGHAVISDDGSERIASTQDRGSFPDQGRGGDQDQSSGRGAPPGQDDDTWQGRPGQDDADSDRGTTDQGRPGTAAPESGDSHSQSGAS